MKKYEPMIILLCIAYLLAILPNPIFRWLIWRVYEPMQNSYMNLHTTLVLIVQGLIKLVVNIIVAIWLYRIAKSINLSPWLWFMFGLLFSLPALILFYILQLYKRLCRPTICPSCGYDNRESIRHGKYDCVECGYPCVPAKILSP